MGIVKFDGIVFIGANKVNKKLTLKRYIDSYFLCDTILDRNLLRIITTNFMKNASMFGRKAVMVVNIAILFAAIVIFSLISPLEAAAQSAYPAVAITASPDTVCAGENTHLYWNSANATTVHIDQGIGYVDNQGDKFVPVNQTSTFKITGTNGTGVTAEAWVTVTVTGSCGPTSFTSTKTATRSATAHCPAGQTGNPVTRTETRSATETSTISQADADSKAQSAAEAAAQSAASQSAQAALVCTNPPQNPTVSLTANPNSVNYGGSSTLVWNSTNATGCTASGGWAGSRGTSGSTSTGALFGTTTFNITCFNSSGQSASDSVTVSVTQQPQNPTVTLTANPNSVQYGGSSNLTWTSQNATSCSATSGTNGWSGSKGLSGNFNTGALFGTTTYVLTCFNSAGQSASDSETVTVSGQQQNNASVTTHPATNITTASATLNGSVNGDGQSVTAWFEYGTNTNLSQRTSENNYGSGFSSVSAPIYNLNPNTTYYFRVVGQTSSQGRIYGNILSFQTTGNFFQPPIFTPPPIQQPTVFIYADQPNLLFNGATTVRWNTTNATSCFGFGGSAGWLGAKSIGPGSFYTGSLTSTRTYTLTCNNGFASASDSVTVSVQPQPIVTTRIIATRVAAPATSLVVISSSIDRNQPIVPSLDNTKPRPGDQINYTVTYQNIGTASITNLILRINLPFEVDYLYSNPSNPVITGNVLTFNLGSLRANGSGTVTVRVRVRENIPEGTSLNFPATLSYIDPAGFPQSVSANVSAEVIRDEEIISEEVKNEVNLLGANVFGAGFWPDSLFGWLLLIILILLLAWLVKYLLSPSNRYAAPVVASYGSYPPHQNTYVHTPPSPQPTATYTQTYTQAPPNNYPPPPPPPHY